MNGADVSNGPERPSKTIPKLDGLPCHKRKLTLRKCELWFVKIVAKLFVKVLKNRHRQEFLSSNFNWKTADAFCCCKCCAIYEQEVNRVTVSHELLVSSNADENFLKRVTPDGANWTNECDMERKCSRGSSPKSTSESIKSRSDADWVLWLSRLRL